MADLSLRQFFQFQVVDPTQGVRSCYAHYIKKKTISLRSLMSGFRIIHISDLHFTNSPITLEIGGQLVIFDLQDSTERYNTITSFMIKNKSLFGTNIVVITGDLTDSGDKKDYEIAEKFIKKLTNGGFDVYSVPGNHDYCKEGNFIATTGLKALKASLCLACPLSKFPPLTGSCLHGEYSNLAPSDAKCLVDDFPTDLSSKEERRQVFIDKITHYSQYPYFKDFGNVRLILLDSMQAEFDEITTDIFAQGKLGDAQLGSLRDLINKHTERWGSEKKIIVCLHHSPFDTDWKGYLTDSSAFLKIISGKIDCLLFGHTTPDDVFQRPGSEDSTFIKFQEICQIPLINCENLEKVYKEKPYYPITVLDLSTYRRIVYTTNKDEPETSLGFFEGGS